MFLWTGARKPFTLTFWRPCLVQCCEIVTRGEPARANRVVSQEGFIWRLRSVALVAKRQGWAVRVAPFPGVISCSCSISAVQWLCNANKKSDIPAKRLYRFFSSLYSVLVSYEISSPALRRPAGSVMRRRHPVGRTLRMAGPCCGYFCPSGQP